MASLLFVCLGNICRSPAAFQVMKSLAEKNDLDLELDCCGLGEWHLGKLPDERMRTLCQTRGYTLATLAKAFKPEYFDSFDYIIVADRKVQRELMGRTSSLDHHSKIHLMTEHADAYLGQDVIDPFHGNQSDFELSLQMIEDACQGWVKYLQNL